MSYSNEFLRNFRPIFFAILKEKKIEPSKVELKIIDEEPDSYGIFEPAGVREVLEQLSEDLDYLTVYTERPAYFYEFAETMYQENGLIVMIFPKEELKAGMRRPKNAELILDFEWDGDCYFGRMGQGIYYVPIHKKPWKLGENLDIIVPMGYNTVIVKTLQEKRRKSGQDRFEEAFYNS